MRLKFLILSFILSSSIVSAKCYKPTDTVELSGVLTTKAVYIEPGDFGWVPKNGFVSYDVLVLNSQVCLEVDGRQITSHILQTNASDYDLEEKRDGTFVTLKGVLVEEHTAHHQQSLILVRNN